jgi:hypothetical protein
MNNLRCGNCSFLNFTSADHCKRCKARFNTHPENSENIFFGEDASVWQPGYQTAPCHLQPTGAPQYLPTPVAPLPHTSKYSGTNALLLTMLVVAVLMALGIGVLWKFGQPVQAHAGWQEYRADDDSFTIEMPTTPLRDVQSQPTPAGEIKAHTMLGNMGSKGVYAVAYSDYPVDLIDGSPDMLLDLAARGAVNNAGATMKGKKSITLDGHPGIEVEMTVPPSKVPGGGLAVCRIYWVKPRIYVILVGGHESSEVYKDRARFLDSLKLRK